MVKSVLSKPLSESHLQRNAFDVGYSNKFTASLGMLLPCFVREVNPNEHYKINPRMFCRSMPMNSAAFIQCKQNIDFFFIPYRLLWSNFPQWFVGTHFPTTAYAPKGESASLPQINLTNFMQFFQTGLSSKSAPTDVLGYNMYRGAVRLLDLLGYGDYSHIESWVSYNIMGGNPLKVSPFRLLAYQKVCSDFYRCANYESQRIDSFNVDTSDGDISLGITDIVSRFMQLRYRPWKKDLFTISSPSYLGQDFMTQPSSSPVFPQVIDSKTQPYQTTSPNFSSGLVNVANGNSPIQSFSISNLRSAFALDKLSRLQSNASDGDYKSQIKARFGFDAYAPQYRCEHIGSASAQVQINPITTTADTLNLNTDVDAGTPAGRIYGNGLGYSDNDVFEYDVKEHGIILGISSFVPDVDYSSYGISPFNLKLKREDFFTPEFDNLGKQPLQSYMFRTYDFTTHTSDGSTTVLVSPNNTVLGYFPRYSEYKTHIDEVHGELNGSVSRSGYAEPSLSNWTAPRYNRSDTKKFDNWISSGLSKDFFYIDPSLYNSIFVNEFNGYQYSDQFICEVNNQVQAVLPMSVSGEPLI